MSCASDFVPHLRSLGYRTTPQRMAILHVLRHSKRHLSPRDVYQMAKRDIPTLTVSTVYRTLEFLAKNRLARHALVGNGHLRYELAEHNHHHIVCRVCGGEIEVDHHRLAPLYRKMEAESGYALIDSHVTFFGVCPVCQKSQARR